MSTPSTDGDDAADDFKGELEERAADVLEDGEFLTFEEHNAERD